MSQFMAILECGPAAGLRRKRHRLLAALCAATLGGSVPLVAGSTAAASTAGITIGFAQGYCGNTWRTTMMSGFFARAKQLERTGQLKSYRYVCANNSASTQESQMADLILDHPSIIILDPASATALNGDIAKAEAAHIPVLVVDSGPVTSSLPYELNANNAQLMISEGKYIAKRLHGAGNVLEVRGIAGLLAETQFHEGLLKAFKPYPKIHIVKSVYGEWTDTNTEEAVASVVNGLPTINAIACQGGCYGAIEAFKAAGRSIPLIVGDNRGTFLHWWASEYKKDHYATISVSTNPGIGAASAYVALQIAEGKKVPKYMYMPELTVTTSTLHRVANTPVDATATAVYPNSWYQKNIIDTPVAAKNYEKI